MHMGPPAWLHSYMLLTTRCTLTLTHTTSTLTMLRSAADPNQVTSVVIENFKAALCQVGIVNWGDRVNINGFKVRTLVNRLHVVPVLPCIGHRHK